eukprot:TRINITY_DN65691_c0_g1_i1.p1 TRINITY_DN65691_c0_g1~~TRINITY_DN65691_c0_g1_i1.p1  ORF type:complete len:106 (-),score=9.64 TRINITY_DN65691_c0_g1_i1:122-439(-)
MPTAYQILMPMPPMRQMFRFRSDPLFGWFTSKAERFSFILLTIFPKQKHPSIQGCLLAGTDFYLTVNCPGTSTGPTFSLYALSHVLGLVPNCNLLIEGPINCNFC